MTPLKKQINNVIKELWDCFPVGFDSLFEKLKNKHKWKTLTPLLKLLKNDWEITFNDLIKFYRDQGYFLGINIWKNDWAIIKKALEDDDERRELFLEFINKLKSKEQELKTKYNIPKQYQLQGAYFEEHKLLSKIEDALNAYKWELVSDDTRIEIDFEGTNLEVSRKEISLAKQQIQEYIQKMLSSGFFEDMIRFQLSYFQKLAALKPNRKPTTINFFRAMIRLTWEFNCLPGWIGMEKYRQFATKASVEEDNSVNFEDLIMPDEFTLFVMHLIVVLNEFYGYLYFKSVNKNPVEELAKSSSLRKFITYGDNSIISKVYIYNWLKAIFKPLVSQCKPDLKEAWNWVMDNTLKCILETTSISLIEQWHLKTISQEPYLIWVMSAFIEYLKNNDQLQEQNVADKLERVANIFAFVSLPETNAMQKKMDKIKKIRKEKGRGCFNEIIDQLMPIESFEDRLSNFELLLELEQNMDANAKKPWKTKRSRI